jgi:hypothetical protein
MEQVAADRGGKERKTFGKTKKALLICGIISSLLYVVIDVTASMQWKEYSFVSQAFSELTAIEAPTRPLMLYGVGIPYNLLLIAFGMGVWLSAGEKRILRFVGAFIVLSAIAGFVAGTIFPMHSRNTQTTMQLTDKLHITFTSVEVLFMLLFIGFGAAAFGKKFRVYSVITILLLILGASWSSYESTRMAAGLPTPWMGLTERVHIYAYLLWVIVSGVVLLKPKRQNVQLPPG